MIINAKIPDSLYQKIEALSQKENISMDELISIALSNQMAMGKQYLEERAKKGSWEDIKRVLDKVPSREPDDYDKL
ncbi:hypothetical protein [Cyanobacterium sp. Dongsha4]|uniref:hypothetical protein n=1 Tax=Cyanobacterium sp. DS4 TaxID=2878255 RepID=UPI002E7FC3A8|nr:hypothetical protein [Cyanobacterium sp. Dongsha4]WVL02548.1 hypothetical protein Dongsha4_18900 [Cyanobacterium sp. Dongsha4]